MRENAGEGRENEKAVGEVGCEKRRERETQTPRLRAPVGTPVETGVGIPDGRKPEAGKGAGPGSCGVTENPVAKSEREKHERHVSEVTVLSSKRGENNIHGPGVTP